MTLEWKTMDISEDDGQRLRRALRPIVRELMQRAKTPEERALYLHSLCDSCGLEIWMSASYLKRNALKEDRDGSQDSSIG